ncbi:MAG: MerR family transcriptional regulator [Bauldia sp.]
MHVITIGEASDRTGVKVPTIRYYEEVGLLAAPGRTSGNHRHYSPDDLRRLLFIRKARELGFAIPAVRTLLSIQDAPEQTCTRADQLARARLTEVTRRIDSLMQLKAMLEDMVADGGHGCASECRVLETLAGTACLGP